MKKFLSRYTPNEWLILLLFASAFISVFALVGVLVLTPVYFLVTRQAKKALPENVFEALLFVFAVLAAVFTFIYARGAIWNEMKGAYSVKEWYLKGLSILIIVLAFDMTFLFRIVTKKSLTDGLKLSVLLSYPCFFIALVQRILGITGRLNTPGRVPSVFLNENYYGVAVECLTFIALSFLFKEKSWKKRWFYLGAVLANIAGLWFSQCRTAFLVVALSLVVFLCFYKKKYIFAIFIAAALGIVVIGLYPSLLPRVDSLSENMDFRIGIWKTALKGIKASPFIGKGYFCYSWLYPSIDSTKFALHAHNMYLEILLNFGLFGFLSLGTYCGYHVVKTIRACRKYGKKNRVDLCLVLSILTALLIHGFFDTTVFWPQTGLFFGLVLASSRAYLPEKTEEK